MRDEKRKEQPKSIFLEIAIDFLIKGLEDFKSESSKNDSSIKGWFRGADLSQKKREVATKFVIELGKFESCQNDQQNKRALEELLSECRQQGQNLSLQAKKTDEGSFGPALIGIDLFLKEFYTVLIGCSGYCLLKVKTNPQEAYEEIEKLTGVQKAIIFCENDGKFYYKETLAKSIVGIDNPLNSEDEHYETLCNAHKKLSQSFSKIPCGKYRKATNAELELILWITDKKACNFLDAIYDKGDAYSIYMYHMAYYLAQVIYEAKEPGIVSKLVQYFVPAIDKVPEMVDILEQCNTDLMNATPSLSNYRAFQIKIVLGSLKQLESGNKELIEKSGYEPKFKLDLVFASSLTLSSNKLTNSEGRLGERIIIATEEIKRSHQKIQISGPKISVSNTTPLILNQTLPLKKSATNSAPPKIMQGVKVFPTHEKGKSNIKFVPPPKKVEEFVDEEYEDPNEMKFEVQNSPPKINKIQSPRNCNVNFPLSNKKKPLPIQSKNWESDDSAVEGTSLGEGDSELVIENHVLNEIPKKTQKKTLNTSEENGYEEEFLESLDSQVTSINRQMKLLEVQNRYYEEHKQPNHEEQVEYVEEEEEKETTEYTFN